MEKVDYRIHWIGGNQNFRRPSDLPFGQRYETEREARAALGESLTELFGYSWHWYLPDRYSIAVLDGDNETMATLWRHGGKTPVDNPPRRDK